jgi:hypothetical protein
MRAHRRRGAGRSATRTRLGIVCLPRAMALVTRSTMRSERSVVSRLSTKPCSVTGPGFRVSTGCATQAARNVEAAKPAARNASPSAITNALACSRLSHAARIRKASAAIAAISDGSAGAAK